MTYLNYANTGDPVTDVMVCHRYDRSMRRCTCGNSITSEVKFRRHLLEELLEDATGTVHAKAWNEGYDQGFSDASV